MRIRTLLSTVAVLALVGFTSSACSSLPDPEVAAPLPQVLQAAVPAYLLNNPAEVPENWHRGIVVYSESRPYWCENGVTGVCWTWHGSARTLDGWAVLDAADGFPELYGAVKPGDDILWTNRPSLIADVKVLKQQAVAIEERK
jgi:hypothetical protein